MTAPVNPMSYEGKPVVLDVVRKERQAFADLINDPKNWNVQTRCTEWEVRDIVGHMDRTSLQRQLPCIERLREQGGVAVEDNVARRGVRSVGFGGHEPGLVLGAAQAGDVA